MSKTFSAAEQSLPPAQQLLLAQRHEEPAPKPAADGPFGGLVPLDRIGGLVPLYRVEGLVRLDRLDRVRLFDRLDRLRLLDRVDRLGLLDRLDRELSLPVFRAFRRIVLLGPFQLVATFDAVAPLAGTTSRSLSWPFYAAHGDFPGPGARLASSV